MVAVSINMGQQQKKNKLLHPLRQVQCSQSLGSEKEAAAEVTLSEKLNRRVGCSAMSLFFGGAPVSVGGVGVQSIHVLYLI